MIINILTVSESDGNKGYVERGNTKEALREYKEEILLLLLLFFK